MPDSAPFRSYLFHGVDLRISADDPEVARAIHSRFRHFGQHQGSGPGGGGPEVRVWFRQGARLRRPRGTGRPVYDRPGAEVSWFEVGDELWLDDDDGLTLRCHPSTGEIEIGMRRTDGEACWLASHGLFTVAFLEVMKRLRCYSVHAAAVASTTTGQWRPRAHR